MFYRSVCLGSALFLACALLPAQSAISLHSGLIQYTSGAVSVENKPVLKTTTNLLSVKKGETLSTGADGAAEILLTPGVFVRMIEDSAIRMDSVALTDTRVTVTKGSVMVECDEISKDNNVAFSVGGHEIELRKTGVFRIDLDPAKLSVVHGEAFIADSTNMTVSGGKSVLLSSSVPAPVKYALNKKTDALYLFSETRSADSAYATNVVSKSMYNAGSSCFSNSWYYMQPVNMYAYLPCNQFASSFGFPFYGLNSGFMYAGNPYYFPPPALVANGFAYGGAYGYGLSNGYNYGYGTPYGAQNYSGGGGTVKPSGTTSNTAGKKPAVTTGTVKVPAYTGVGSTNPTYVTVPRSSYLAGSSTASSAAAPGMSMNSGASHTTMQNRFQGASSLTTSHQSLSSYRGNSGAFSAQGGTFPAASGRSMSASPSVSAPAAAATSRSVSAGSTGGSGGGSHHQ